MLGHYGVGQDLYNFGIHDKGERVKVAEMADTVSQIFLDAWKRIVLIGAAPTFRLPMDSEDSKARIFDSLRHFASEQPILVDSAILAQRPTCYVSSDLLSVISDHAISMEFVVTHDPPSGRFWAVTEEESEWFIFENA